MAPSTGRKGATTKSPDALTPIKGLDAVNLYTSLIDSAVTRHTKEGILKRNKAGYHDIPYLSTYQFETELDFLKSHHTQPDFDDILAMSRETVTQVELFMQEDGISSLQPVESGGLNNLC